MHSWKPTLLGWEKSKLWEWTRIVVLAPGLVAYQAVVHFCRRRWGRQLIDIVAGRTAQSAVSWFLAQPAEWLDGIRWAVSGHVRVLSDGL